MPVNHWFKCSYPMTLPVRLISLLLLFSAFYPKSQPPVNLLANSAWKGVVNMKEPAIVVLYFKKDTANMYLAAGMRLIEQGTYTVDGNTLTLQKIRGGSPCDIRAVGKISFSIVGDVLLLKPLTDDCSARMQAWSSLPYNRTVLPTK